MEINKQNQGYNQKKKNEIFKLSQHKDEGKRWQFWVLIPEFNPLESNFIVLSWFIIFLLQ